jgi:hypothetical protein
LIIANTAGKPIHFSAEGLRLLFLGTNPRSGPGVASSPSTVLPAAVVQHCISLSRIFLDDASPAAPTCRHSNIWGDFTFRAQWLDQNNPGSDLIGIIVTHKVPLPLMLTRSVQRFPLSRRQAERLGISAHTAKQHGRWICNKLDVHNRTELVSKILSA